MTFDSTKGEHFFIFVIKKKFLTVENVVDGISNIREQRRQNDVVAADTVASNGQGRYETEIRGLDQSGVASELRELLWAHQDRPELENRETLASLRHSRFDVEEGNLGSIFWIHQKSWFF